MHLFWSRHEPRSILSVLLDKLDYLFMLFGNSFQKRRVSSPAPVTTVSASGDMARYKTLKLCPVKVAIFLSDGYFQTTMALSEYPCVLTISFELLLNMRLQTWDPVSIELTSVPILVFQNFMQRSAVPPPDASKPLWCGLHAIALTAALWDPNLCIGSVGLELFPLDHTINLLSLPPDARYWSSNDHFRPQISCLWHSYLLM